MPFCFVTLAECLMDSNQNFESNIGQTTMLRRGEQSLPNHACLFRYMFIAIETFGSLAFMCKDIYFEAFLDRAKSAFNQSSLLSAFNSLKHSFLEKFVAFFYVLELTELLAFAA